MDPGSSHAAIASKGRVCGASARPPGKSSPPSSKTTTPLHSRLQPCSGWLAMTWAAARAISPADGAWRFLDAHGPPPSWLLSVAPGTGPASAADRCAADCFPRLSGIFTWPPANLTVSLRRKPRPRGTAPAGPGLNVPAGRWRPLQAASPKPTAPDKELPEVLPSAPLAIEGPKSGLTGTEGFMSEVMQREPWNYSRPRRFPPCRRALACAPCQLPQV
jgi:hypothetical protein